MKSISSLVITIIVALFAGAAGSYWFAPHKAGEESSKTKSAYQRVIDTNTLRCAYWVYPPSTSKDPNTGKIGGFSVAVVEEMAKRLGLKVDWTEEVTFGNMLAGLETHRYDAVCTGAFITAGRSRHSESTIPLVYNGIIAVVRADDTRFDNDISVANNASMTLTAMDGDITTELAAHNFPNAKMLSIAQNGNYLDVYLNVVGKKADMFFDEAGRVSEYIKNNPNLVKILNIDHPLKVSPWVIPVNKGEHDLVGMLNGALMEMLYDGSIKRIAKNYEPLTKGYYYFKPPIEAGRDNN